MTGLSMHIGSQITQLSPFIEATNVLVACMQELRQEGFQINTVDLGGGLGISYHQEAAPTPEEFGNALSPMLQPLGCRVILEPGRAIVGDAGILVMKVLYTKQNGGKHFTIVDAAMTECLRPALYQAYHAVLPVRQESSDARPTVTTDIVGPVCESSDFLAKHRELPQPQQGDLLALCRAGAYGFAMASQYNSRPHVAEVLVNNKNFQVIRQRETYADLIRGEDMFDMIRC
jgi:diaminopimelate decarboxylase